MVWKICHQGYPNSTSIRRHSRVRSKGAPKFFAAMCHAASGELSTSLSKMALGSVTSRHGVFVRCSIKDSRPKSVPTSPIVIPVSSVIHLRLSLLWLYVAIYHVVPVITQPTQAAQSPLARIIWSASYPWSCMCGLTVSRKSGQSVKIGYLDRICNHTGLSGV